MTPLIREYILVENINQIENLKKTMKYPTWSFSSKNASSLSACRIYIPEECELLVFTLQKVRQLLNIRRTSVMN